MTQLSLFWDGASLGDADRYAPYDLGDAAAISPTVDIFFRAILNGTGNRGVLKGWANELAVTGVATPVAVNTGGAVVYGMPYENTASVNVVIPVPGFATRYDRIVLRRDWAAQTIRITRLPGTEGGTVPAMTQSPAPDGSGIYDIPLASLECDTLGNIAVTDEREWITMSTAPLTNVIATAHIVNESVDWAARVVRDKILFVGGGDWNPMANNARFSYTSASYTTANAASTWGSAAATAEGWRVAAGTTVGLHTIIRVPPEWAGGDIETYIWWMEDAGAVAWSASWLSHYQVWEADSTVVYSDGRTNTGITGTYVLDSVQRQQIRSIDEAHISAGSLVDYCVYYYNSAGAEAALVLGLEFVYQGYL